ncbi:MAG: protein of unknown function DUF3830 [Rhodobacteraceae bacterium HLUCCA09]|nr:MAG: protein of unknown function DUF3830 [Rhodobacteraceae bacterium HLUCCA09]
MADRLIFDCAGQRATIALTDAHAPRTLAAVRSILPVAVTIHCSKIAGAHLYWPTPILERLEHGADIHALPAGSFLYYPDRQYLEITYDALQAETAAVSLLGRFEGDLAWLRDLGEDNRRRSGQRILTARLSAEGEGDAPPAVPDAADATGPLAALRTARRAAWAAEPDELRALLRREGLNIPLGPVVTAEGEFRRTQELLWRLWRNDNGHDDALRAAMAREALELTLARVVGYCHLHEAGAALEAGHAALGRPGADVGEVLGELVLYCGRMAGWLDLHVPWWEANEIARRNVAAEGEPA